LETLTPTQRAAVKAVDATRRQKHRKLSQAGTSALTGSKWAWLKKYPNGRSAEAISFRALNQLNLKTSRAWCIKENFTQFWSYSYKGAAKRFFKAWSSNAMRSKLEPVKKVVKMLRRHQQGTAQLQSAQNQQRLCRRLQQCYPTHQGQCPWVS
jgi:transposase